MVVVPNEAKLNELAKFYAETVSEVVADVNAKDYENFTKFIENTDKPIKITPIHFIVYLTGVSLEVADDYYLKNKKLEHLLTKRASLMH
ncbi:hypothetical protein QYM42_02400 [Lactococcus lactis]|uniref:hypothetical protein n=1 Tax=Lactococcus lactis TaxID=1358 RepID=UPI002658E365|nr:hypothetical protein [Lactococcus lactis]WKF73636.1 hypothetical protein QYM42_02400 [Lactococcus lactis]